MKRDTAREIAVQLLFANKFNDIQIEDFLTDSNFASMMEYNDLYSEEIDDKSKSYIQAVINTYRDNSARINELISKNSNNWDIKRLSGTALACLKCALAEMLFFDDIPNSATINSVINIAKKYDDAKTVSFINGVLGSVDKTLPKNE